MVGAPGAGKSTFNQERLKNEPGLWCSRDKVRFSMVREDEDYFSKENEVFKKWITYINNGISSKAHSVIYVDATTFLRHQEIKLFTNSILKMLI